jgi:hypothetical protein
MEDLAVLTLHLTYRDTAEIGIIGYLQVEAIRSSHITISTLLKPYPSQCPNPSCQQAQPLTNSGLV